MIQLKNVTFRYPQNETPVFSGFSAQFERGEVVAVSGKNGSGKTTLTKLLSGILRPSAGRITIDGTDIAKMGLFEIGQKIGYVFQNPNRQLFCDTVFNEVAFGLQNAGLDEAQIENEANYHLRQFSLAGYSDVYPGKLSCGEKQRLAIAAVLALGTDFLVLDEPTTGLDALNRRAFGNMLLNLRKELNCGIVFVSHDVKFIDSYADRELVMAQ